MPVVLVAMLSFTVHYLLLLATAGLCRQSPMLLRFLLGAGVGAAYAAVCMQPGFAFLGNTFGRLLCLFIMGAIAFGWQKLLPLGTLLVLSLGVDGIVAGARGALAGLCAIFLLWLLLRRNKTGTVPVTLHYGQKKLSLMALQDTGNLLRDPVSGLPVLVIGPEAALELTGLTADRLRAPLENISAVPGLRLIPYKAVGSSGFLLGMRVDDVRIGNKKCCRVVAFAPEGLGGNGTFEALTGGMA